MLGCGDSDFQFAPVSGKVTLNDQPLADATITFLPSGSAGEAGPPSWAVTDAQGSYSLQSRDGQTGAVVGQHRVMITTSKEPEGDDERDDVYANRTPEKVPLRYNAETELTFDVPVEGAEGNADFTLTAP
jgi:hypothetical protein